MRDPAATRPCPEQVICGYTVPMKKHESETLDVGSSSRSEKLPEIQWKPATEPDTVHDYLAAWFARLGDHLARWLRRRRELSELERVALGENLVANLRQEAAAMELALPIMERLEAEVIAGFKMLEITKEESRTLRMALGSSWQFIADAGPGESPHQFMGLPVSIRGTEAS